MKKNSKNELGFTMVELLAAITILGLLMAVAIGAVSWILDLNEKRYYSTLEKNVALAAESYYADHRASLPSAVGQSRKLLLKTLVKQKYLLDVLDYGKGDCTTSDYSYVVVTKYSKKDYLYNVYFDCPAYKTKQEDSIKDISITIDFDFDEKKIKNAVSNIKIKSTDENKIASYEYIIYKDGQHAYNSENISAGYVDSINQQIKLKNYVPGNIRVVVTAYDMYGNRKTKEKEVAIYNNGFPSCGPHSPVYNKWTTSKDAKRKITIQCVDGDIECLNRKFSRTFTSDMKTGYIPIVGTNNKEKKCPVGVYIDKTTPVCGSDDGSKVWTNKTRKITVQCSDATSGCTKENGYSKTFSNTTKTGKIEIKDNAGNKKDCEVDVYVDKVPPKCGKKVENKTWTNKGVEVGVYCEDEDSGCKKDYYSEVIDYTTKTKTFTISDKAGNTTKCTVDAYVDVNKPTVPTSEIRKDNSKGALQKQDGAWTANTLWWGRFKSTSTSGINRYEYSEKCTGKDIRTLSSSYTYDQDKNTSYCIRAVNNAGTPSDWSKAIYFRIDKTAPTLDGSITSRDNRFQSRNVYVNLTASDNVTKAADLDMYISNTGYETDGSWKAYKSQSNLTIPGTYDGGTKYVYVTVRDGVGHKTRKRLSYKVYKQCTTKIDDGNWYNKGSCSAVCGGGTRQQEKKKKDAYTGASCGVVTQKVECNTQDCCSRTRAGSWSSWSGCTASCGGGTKTRTRKRYSDYYSQNTHSCPTNSSDTETVACNTHACAPAKPTITNPTGGNWVNYDFSLEARTTSAASTIGYWQYTYDTSSWITYSDSIGKGKNKITTTPFSAERNQNVYIRACTAKGLCSPAASTRIRIDKTPPYTPTLDWETVTEIDGHFMKTGLYGNCVGNRCIQDAPYDYSVTLQNQGKICYETRKCDISPTTKTTSPRNCAYHKRFPCGYMSIITNAGDKESNGVSSGIKTVTYGSNVNKYCPFTYDNSSYYVVFARVFYAYDNAGNKSKPLYHWELMNDAFDGNLTDRFYYSNGTWVMKSGTSCPTPRS